MGPSPSPLKFKYEDSYMSDISDMLTSISIADSRVKGYKFHCAANCSVHIDCRECDNALVSFVTLNLEEAYQHGLRNNVPIWVLKDE